VRSARRQNLKQAGWTAGSAAGFLGLRPEEAMFLELKLALAASLKKRRLARRMTQAQVAKLLGSSQPRVAKMESGDRAVTLDLLVRALFALGASRRELARLFDSPKRRQAA
jgi:predicted XRE-type DNA-binding protein